MALTDIAIRNAKPSAKPYKLADGGGLFLLVNPTGSRLWRLKYRIAGREKLLAIGPYPDVSLAKAREQRDTARRAIVDGADPSALKKGARLAAKVAPASTFRAVAEEHLGKLEREGLAPVTLAKRRWLLGSAYPQLGDRDVATITSADVLQVLRTAEAKGLHETARRMRSVVGSVFRYAIATQRAENDPTFALRGALTSPKVKRDYLRWLKEAKGKSDASLDATRKALARFEASTGAKDFATFRREQAISFKERLAETDAHRTGEPLSAATQTATLTALRDFFVWLAWQPGFKSKIGRADVDYLTPSRRDAARAKAPKHRDFPSLEQVRAAIAAVPTDTVLNRRTRALLAFLILTGIRDGALVSLTLGDVDLTKSPPVVVQDPNCVDTKFAKAIVSFFFRVGDDFAAIVTEWVDELRRVHLFGPTDPLFPRTRVAVAGDGMFAADGIDRAFWSDASPVRDACRKAFTAAGLPTFSPHAFRHTLGHLQHTMCRTIEEAKAWSQNLGHENMGTTFTSYGHIDTHRQGELIGRIGVGGDAGDETENLARELSAVLARYGGISCR